MMINNALTPDLNNVSFAPNTSFSASAKPDISSPPSPEIKSSVVVTISSSVNKAIEPASDTLLVYSNSKPMKDDSGALESQAEGRQQNTNQPEGEEAKQSTQSASNDSNTSVYQLSEQELKIVENLKLRDREVRSHEQAHKSVGGQYAGAISYTYQSGPDGKRYAVGGEVPIDVSPIAGNPEATISKMTVVRAAAMAPAQPSTQDMQVAAQASRQLMAAQNQLLTNNVSELRSNNKQEDNESTMTESEAAADDAFAGSERVNEASIKTFEAVYNMAFQRPESLDIKI